MTAPAPTFVEATLRAFERHGLDIVGSGTGKLIYGTYCPLCGLGLRIEFVPLHHPAGANLICTGGCAEAEVADALTPWRAAA